MHFWSVAQTFMKPSRIQCLLLIVSAGEASFILHDRHAEGQYGFSLSRSLESRKGPKLFEGYSIYVSPKMTKPPAKQLAAIAEGAGAKVCFRFSHHFGYVQRILGGYVQRILGFHQLHFRGVLCCIVSIALFAVRFSQLVFFFSFLFFFFLFFVQAQAQISCPQFLEGT